MSVLLTCGGSFCVRSTWRFSCSAGSCVPWWEHPTASQDAAHPDERPSPPPWGMIDRIHRDTAYRWATPAPAGCARLAQRAQRVLRIAHFPDRGPAGHPHLAQLAGSKPQRRETPFTRNELHTCARATRELGSLSGPELDTVHRRAYRNIAQWQAISRSDRRPAARHQLVARRDATRARRRSAAHRPRTTARRCEHCDSDRIRASRPWPESRPSGA